MQDQALASDEAPGFGRVGPATWTVGVILWVAASLSAWLVLGADALWASVVLGAGLAFITAIDARAFLIPNWLSFPLILAGVAFSAVANADVGAWPPQGAVTEVTFWTSFFTTPLGASVLGAGLGYSAFAAIGLWYYAVRGRVGLGMGDAKLLAALGAWLGFLNLPIVTAMAAVGALVAAVAVRASGRPVVEVAFGPFLALSAWIVWLFGGSTLAWGALTPVARAAVLSVW